MEINQDALFHALMEIAALLREERAEAQRLSIEIAALRNTLQEVSGDRFLPIVEKQRTELLEITAASRASMLRKMDTLIPLFSAAIPGASVPDAPV
jgi:hypothetical protein